MTRDTTMLLISLVLTGTPTLAAQDAAPPRAVWTQWRGPERSATVSAEPRWPDSLQSSAPAETWSASLGPSYSGPIVSQDMVYTTETRDKTTEVVHAYDRSSGREVWTREWAGGLSVPFFAKRNGDWIRSTPCLDEGRLYVAGIRDVLYCLDAATGEEIWSYDFVANQESTVPTFGCVCSPLVVGSEIYLQAGGGFACLEKATGKLRWLTLKDGGGMNGSAFSSPVFAEIDQVPQLLVQTRTELCGVAPEDGRVLWRQEVPAFRGMNILTPIVQGNQVFTSSYRNGSYLYELSRDSSGQWQVQLKWTSPKRGYMSTPAVIDGHIYLFLQDHRFCCLEWETGEECWTSETLDCEYCSLVQQGNRILALDHKGTLRLIEANPQEFVQLDERAVAEAETWAHLAVCGDELFVRSLEKIVALRWSPR